MKSAKISLLYVPVPNKTVARRISQILLKEKHIACANILPVMESIYVWKKKLTKSHEVLLLVKLPTKMVQATRARIMELHPYEVPCIIEIPIVSANSAYSAWIADCTQ